MIKTITWTQEKSQIPKRHPYLCMYVFIYLFIYLFIYDLFNNTVRHSAYIESNDVQGSEWYIGKHVQRKGMASLT